MNYKIKKMYIDLFNKKDFKQLKKLIDLLVNEIYFNSSSYTKKELNNMIKQKDFIKKLLNNDLLLFTTYGLIINY